MKSAIHDVILKNISLLKSDNINEYKYIPLHNRELPSLQKLTKIVDLFRSIIFPGYYGDTITDNDTLGYHLGLNLEQLYNLLKEQVQNGLCFNATEDQ